MREAKRKGKIPVASFAISPSTKIRSVMRERDASEIRERGDATMRGSTRETRGRAVSRKGKGKEKGKGKRRRKKKSGGTGGRRGREPTARPKCTGGYLNAIDARLHDLSDDRSDVELFPPFCGLSAVTPLLVAAYYSRREIQYGESATFDSSCGQIVPRALREIAIRLDPFGSLSFGERRSSGTRENEREENRARACARARESQKSRPEKCSRARARENTTSALPDIFLSRPLSQS